MPDVKPGVVFWPGLDERVERDIEIIDRTHMRTVGRAAYITSARDGKHSQQSLHYAGRAIDLRTRDLTQQQRWALQRALADALGEDYDVILEETHLHVELDPDEDDSRALADG